MLNLKKLAFMTSVTLGASALSGRFAATLSHWRGIAQQTRLATNTGFRSRAEQGLAVAKSDAGKPGVILRLELERRR